MPKATTTITTCVRYELSVAAKVKGGWMHTEKEDKSGGEVIWKKA